MKKRCGRCKQEKVLDDFTRDITKSSGRSSYCRECTKFYNKVFVKKQKQLEWGRRDYEKNKHKHAARAAVHALLASGKMKAEGCFLCKKFPAEAHHLIYSFKTKIIWLCKRHHELVHH